MIITNDKLIANKTVTLPHKLKDDELRFIHNEIGYNYRLTNIQAAMGVAQLKNSKNT